MAFVIFYLIGFFLLKLSIIPLLTSYSKVNSTLVGGCKGSGAHNIQQCCDNKLNIILASQIIGLMNDLSRLNTHTMSVGEVFLR